MPLDTLNDLDHFYYKATWQETFAWLPHVCKRSDRRIWLEHAYQGTAMYTGPGEPVYEHHWHSSKEHLVWLLIKTN